MYKWFGLPPLPASLTEEDSVRLRIDAIIANREAIISAWLAETGIHPKDAVLCQQSMDDGSIRFWVETKEENERRMARFPVAPAEEGDGE